MNPVAASPNWWEVTRGNPNAVRRVMAFRQGNHLQLRPSSGFLQVSGVALQLTSETLAMQPPLSQAQVALD